MKLCYCRVPGGNFGDDLNAWLWPRLLPEIDFQSADDGWSFVGIGTLLNDHHVARLPSLDEKLFFSTGAGLFRDGYRPVVPDPTWHVEALRGPLTSKLLGLSPDLAVTDGAALVAGQPIEPRDLDVRTVYMPHLSNAGSGWRRASESAGITYLAPSDSVDSVLRTIAGSDLVLAEAMHAAIVADAMRVPWIPVRSVGIDAFKWRDWCASLELEYEPYRLPPLWQRAEIETPLGRKYRDMKTRVASERLRWLARRGQKFLSTEAVFRSRFDELRRRLESVREDWNRGGFTVPIREGVPANGPIADRRREVR